MSDIIDDAKASVPSRLSSEKLNLIIAACAILISAASFYLTYSQAESARQQVKAMTYPYVQFLHGNFHEESEENRVHFELKNGGVGPAIVKKISMQYKDKVYADVGQFLKACCFDALKEMTKKLNQNEGKLTGAEISTSQIKNRVLPMTEEVEFLSLRFHEDNQDLWRLLNKERWELKVSICYCSILSNCYESNNLGEVIDVKNCQ